MSNTFLRLLNEKPVLLADGATGTNLFALGLQSGDAPELWNIEHPGRIAAHYRSFVEAGSDIILTNSFGGNRYRLKLHRAEDRVDELNRAAARIAREVVAETDRPVAVAGSIGPTGEILQPNGPLSVEAAAAAFAEQGRALAEGGVDVLWIETLSAREELEAALAGVANLGLPVVCTMSFDTNGRTMMGLAPAELARLAATHGAHPQACGSNCGVGAAEVVASIALMHRALDGQDPAPVLVAKANCGIPEFVGGRIVYNGTPDLMAEYARLARAAGAHIIGGCCGTTPDHVRAMRAALDEYHDHPVPDAATIVERLGEISTGAQAQLRGDFSIAGGSASGQARPRGRTRRRVERQ